MTIATVYEINIVNGKPVATKHEIVFDESMYAPLKDSTPLYPSDALQEEAGRLNRSFNKGYFGH